MFERGEVVVRISGGQPMMILSVADDGHGHRVALCEGPDANGRLTSWRIAEDELELYFPPSSHPKPKSPRSDGHRGDPA